MMVVINYYYYLFVMWQHLGALVKDQDRIRFCTDTKQKNGPYPKEATLGKWGLFMETGFEAPKYLGTSVPKTTSPNLFLSSGSRLSEGAHQAPCQEGDEPQHCAAKAGLEAEAP
ncbi:unnamed protein product [Natator depressus]